MTDAHQAPAPAKGGVVPYLSIDGAVKAVEFYKKAFGAVVAAARGGAPPVPSVRPRPL